MFNKVMKGTASDPSSECFYLGFCSCSMFKTLTNEVLLCCLKLYIYNISYKKYKSVAGAI